MITTIDTKGREGTPVSETKEVLTTQTETEKETLLEELNTSFTVDLYPDFSGQRKKEILALVKVLPKEQQQLFQKVSIIGANTNKDGKKLSDFYGLDLAIKELWSSDQQKIIITSFVEQEDILKLQKEKAEFLFDNPRVDFIQLPFSAQMLVDFILNKQNSRQEQISLLNADAFLKLIEQKISKFFHDARHRDRKPEVSSDAKKTEKLQAFFSLVNKPPQQIILEDEMIGLLDIQHPEYQQLPREEKLSKIVAFAELADAIILPEGTRFEGVFVDRDGTLYDVEKKEFKQGILDLVKKYQTEGKEVTIRTLWDVKQTQALLDEAGIALNVKSKADFKGGTVEIAIDDLSEDELFNVIKVKAEKHIKV